MTIPTAATTILPVTQAIFSFVVSSFYYINRVQATIVLPDLNVALLEEKIQQVCVSPAGVFLTLAIACCIDLCTC